ncbi:MAG: UDP-N-acetylmuramate--L-alanine ligase [Bdellovibrionales bacterium]|nr:UDP-N-acetylmuramate--L-alanine ligase [Bdellovibrionales bacterium]
MSFRKDPKDFRLHFIGIGGIGMSGIAQVFRNQGFSVSGSDISDSEILRRLSQIGVTCKLGHCAENLGSADVVIVSSAVRDDNPELIEARKRRLPVIPRAEMLGELMRGKLGVAVAGTHGKTTTTSMMATVLTSAGWDPTMVIGGKVDSLGGNAKLGQGKYVIAEADESDGSFLHLPFTYAVVTNIDDDHLDHYGSLKAIEEAFIEFIGKSPFYGLTAVCGEDPGVRRCLSRFSKPFVTYGFSSESDYWSDSVANDGLKTRFRVFHHRDGLLGDVTLNVPGRHNVLNALAVVAICRDLGMPFNAIAYGLEQYRGVKRRFEVCWQDNLSSQVIVDDYAHHPTEIETTLTAARQFWKGRIVVVFQPHRYTRTLHCLEGFLNAFGCADVVMLTDIYPAGEVPIDGVSSKNLSKQIQQSSDNTVIRYTGDLDESKAEALAEFRPGDLLICMGAGSISKLADSLVSRMKLKGQDV